MSDRELLELAAKAAFGEFADQMLQGGWNPLEDDGDALRLAVILSINIYINYKYCIAEILSDGDSPPIHKKEYCDSETKKAATRRAIVRAAAEIWREQQ